MIQQRVRRAPIAPVLMVVGAAAIFWFTDWPDGLGGPFSTRAKVMITAGFGLVFAVVLYAMSRGRSNS